MNKVLLIILDGWGYAQPWGGNAIAVAQTPYFDYLWRTYPHTLLASSGTDVGLPGHEMGNSEVGHLNIGAGHIVQQDILKVNSSIEDGSFYKNQVIVEAFSRVRGTSNNIHLMGLLSDGGVHSHISHLLALLQVAKQQKVKNVYIHTFLDGRDTPPMSAQSYMAHLQQALQSSDDGKIATVSGRYWAMDRNKKWNRIDRVYRAMTEGVGLTAPSAVSAIGEAYSRGETDEFIQPTIILHNNQKPAVVKDGDSIIYWNFRSDRARELTQAFLKPAIQDYQRHKVLKNLYFATLIPYGYEQDIGVKPKVAFTPDKINVTLASTLAKYKIPQFHIAETEKYAHITYFLNGTVEQPYPLEDRQIIPSPRVATYDLAPEMSAPLISQSLLKIIPTQKYPFIVVNYANTDMVGHSGNFNALVKAAETVDLQLRSVIEVAKKNDYFTMVTADHGNAEQVLDPLTNEASTEHTNNPVPFVLVPPLSQNSNKFILRTSGRLSDIASTVLCLMKIDKPKEMTGRNLIAITTNNKVYDKQYAHK